MEIEDEAPIVEERYSEAAPARPLRSRSAAAEKGPKRIPGGGSLPEVTAGVPARVAPVRPEHAASPAAGARATILEPSRAGADERAFDHALRPRRFAEFTGQGRVVANLALYVEAWRRRAGRATEALPMDHLLLSGLPGLGKTTLAHLVANEAGVRIRATSGPAIEKPGDLAGILTNLERGDVLFIDEIHRLPAIVEEYLYSAMEDFAIDIVIDQGPAARTIKLDLKPFTLVGATTREGLLSAPFRSRFGVLEKLELYPPEDLVRIIRRSADLLGVAIAAEAAELLAHRARGTPRLANRFLRRLRDVAEVRGAGSITRTVALEGLAMLGVDEAGLDGTDRRILEALVRQQGAPVGLKTIAVVVGEEEDTIEDVYEPFLIQRGYLVKTPRGRRPTELAWRQLGLAVPRAPADPQALLFDVGDPDG